jgi:proteic killer suppression protein
MGYINVMIKTFAHKGLEKFYRTGSKAGIQAKHAKRLRLILAMLEQARVIEDMRAPGLALHSLHGDLAGQWAVTIQANWRVIFRFTAGDAEIVNYIDYH